MSLLSRRRFLLLSALTAAGVVAVLARRRIGRLLASRLHPALGNSPPGALPAGTERALLAVAAALVGEPCTSEEYANAFRWHAGYDPGLRDLYVRFAEEADARARGAGSRDFATAATAVRLRVLDALAPRRSSERLLAGFVAPRHLLYTLHVRREVFRVFARTDAWIRAGYTGWPGAPRGFEGLDQPPRRPV